MLQNWNTARAVLESAKNAEGSALKENEAYAEGIEGHLTKLSNTWQEIWNNTANRDQINWFLDMANGVSELVNKFGLLNTAVGLFAGTVMTKANVGRGNSYSLPSLNMPTARWW